MVFAKYFYKRFFVYFISINLLLSTLFNVIEFFEKLVRVGHTNIQTIFHFITLNFLPTFFQLIPITTWLTTMLLLREFHQQNEWDIILIINIGYKKLLTLFFNVGLFLAIFSFFVNENFILQFTDRAQQFKVEKFKQKSSQKLINKWYILKENLFCYFETLDFNDNEGKNLLLVYTTPKFTFEKIINCPHFYIDTKKQIIQIPEGSSFKVVENIHQKLINERLQIPSFFACAQLGGKTTSLTSVFINLIATRSILLRDTWNDIFNSALQRLIFYLQILFYPMLTFSLFAMAYHYKYYKWILILLPYPLTTISSLFTTHLFQQSVSPLLSMILYVIISIWLILFRIKFI